MPRGRLAVVAYSPRVYHIVRSAARARAVELGNDS
jgi:hypothetical protein